MSSEKEGCWGLGTERRLTDCVALYQCGGLFRQSGVHVEIIARDDETFEKAKKILFVRHTDTTERWWLLLT
jgi:hypothetical protein